MNNLIIKPVSYTHLLVQLLGSHGGKAMGLCGLDGRMLMAEKLVTGADLGYVGEIKEVNPEPLNLSLIHI